jgi:hypothetical protein
MPAEEPSDNLDINITEAHLAAEIEEETAVILCV